MDILSFFSKELSSQLMRRGKVKLKKNSYTAVRGNLRRCSCCTAVTTLCRL